MRQGKSSQIRQVLFLFPRTKFAKKLLSLYLANGFQVILFNLTEKKKQFLPEDDIAPAESLKIIKVGDQPLSNWKNFSQPLMNQIQNSRLIINFVGKDLLRVKIKNKDEDWNIDTKNPIQVRMAFIDSLLKNLASDRRYVWINLAIGMMGRAHDKNIFCNTRYGLTGLKTVIQMNPSLSDIEIINICLTSFRNKSGKATMEHCANCLTDKFEEEIDHISDDDDFADLLLEKSLQSLQQQR
ncbi:MAG: hypothetical protein GXO74_12770 [Calditrichaeota bacterium]|nr:hypothetical protein [Calditrichota bacterium]